MYHRTPQVPASSSTFRFPVPGENHPQIPSNTNWKGDVEVGARKLMFPIKLRFIREPRDSQS